MKNTKVQICRWMITAFLLATFNVAIGDTIPIPLNFDKNSVQFIFTKMSETNYAPLGTCFMVNVTTIRKPTFFHRLIIPVLFFFTEKPPLIQNAPYFVTAKHVLFDENGNLRPNMYVRVDNENGGVFYSSLSDGLTNGAGRIITPQDKSVDLAVFTIAQPKSIEEIRAISTAQTLKPKLGWIDASIVADTKKLKKYNIREGEEMFFVGLFTPFYGANENIPICRFGHLSMLPDEPVMLTPGKSQRVYLMETEAFGGNSGSPAFFSFSKSYGAQIISRFRPGGTLFNYTEKTGILFAGVVIAYFPDWSQIITVNAAATSYSSQNTGIAAITPSPYLYDILFSKTEIEFRDNLWKLTAPKGYKK